MNRWLRFSTLAVVFLGLVAPTALVAQVQDDFDDDPQENPDFELHQPQTGILYSIVEDGANNWWRWEIPALGDLGLNWDSWTTVDLAPKLRHAIDPGEDFVIQTRVRIDPAAPPAAATN
ncbi:MAG: hypothetical protein JW940_10015, partial [Polyangiaceae bacterium]|nr:hypothetical protein [Polyangiaceae bacterium]